MKNPPCSGVCIHETDRALYLEFPGPVSFKGAIEFEFTKPPLKKIIAGTVSWTLDLASDLSMVKVLAEKDLG